jgi:type VI secretion system ImpH/TssG family protein
MIAQAYQDPDPLRDLLDIFNHRLIPLYYRAWKRNHPAAGMDPGAPDRLTLALCALIGQEPGSPAGDWVVAPERLLRYAGLLMGRSRPGGGLETAISDYFGIDQVKVQPFLERRVRLHPWETSRLGAPGRNNRLGRSLVLGEWVNDVAGQFRLSLGPLSLQSFQKLQPGQPAFNELIFLVNFYTRHQLDFELELILDREDIKPFVLSAKWGLNPLGRYSWLGRPPRRTASVYIESTSTE